MNLKNGLSRFPTSELRNNVDSKKKMKDTLFRNRNDKLAFLGHILSRIYIVGHGSLRDMITFNHCGQLTVFRAVVLE